MQLNLILSNPYALSMYLAYKTMYVYLVSKLKLKKGMDGQQIHKEKNCQVPTLEKFFRTLNIHVMNDFIAKDMSEIKNTLDGIYGRWDIKERKKKISDLKITVI